MNWGSAAWDPVRNILLANTNRVAAVTKLIPREEMGAAMQHPDEMAWGGEFARQRGTPYGMHRDWLVSPDGPALQPARLGRTGGVRSEHRQAALGSAALASRSVSGGPMATAGGLIFTAAAIDPHLHAFDADTGREVWKAELPASAQSTPMTYEWQGKQYVVICAGGHGKLKSKMGDSVVAFALQ